MFPLRRELILKLLIRCVPGDAHEIKNKRLLIKKKKERKKERKQKIILNLLYRSGKHPT